MNNEEQTATDLAGILAPFVCARTQGGVHDWLCVTPHAALLAPHGHCHFHQHGADRPAVGHGAPPYKQHNGNNRSVIQRCYGDFLFQSRWHSCFVMSVRLPACLSAQPTLDAFP